MKKIMFNDKFSLTQAVLDGRKTQTRRIVPSNYWLIQRSLPGLNDEYIERANAHLLNYSRYKLGEVVAVAQSYKDCGNYHVPKEHPGWNNKLFVAALLMPHRISITNVRVERLQDISDEDCLAEGIEKVKECENLYRVPIYHKSGRITYISADTPREAYAALIDKISGKGTWESNPWVFLYDFERLENKSLGTAS